MALGSDALRIYVIYRADLPEMTRAKGEVQFGHAVAGLMHSAPEDLRLAYMADNQPKIAMEVDGLDGIEAIAAKARARGAPYFVVKDAAHTVFAEPTVTCIGLGPLSKTDGNALTRHARMRT